MNTLKFNTEYIEKKLCIIEVPFTNNLWKMRISSQFTNVNTTAVRLP